MGLILGRFCKKKTTLEKLEKLDADIKSIEKFRLNTELAQRRIVGQFILVSAGVYIIVAGVFYFYFFPATFYDQMFYITPLLLVPFIILFVKRLLTWYYRRKLSRNENKISMLRNEKKKLLDEVMDTETYKVAKDILEKFAPDQLRKNSTPLEEARYELTPTMFAPQPTSTLRSRHVLTNRAALSLMPKTPASKVLPSPQFVSTPIQPLTSTNGQQSMSVVRNPAMPTQLPMVREILPRDRSVLDRMVEYLVGDGPSNRYALICRNCQSHNGMALREEFDYIAFRCCYCYTFNPARKLRPAAPKLEIEPTRSPIKRQESESDDTSDAEKYSGTDSDTDLQDMIRFGNNPEAENVPADVDSTPEKPELDTKNE